LRVIIVFALGLIAMPAIAQTPFNDPSRNIFDTYDQACDGSDASIMFCDGFEDGSYITADAPGSAATDYWQKGVFHVPYPDQFGRDFAECNSTSIDPNKADFGAAGTACTATMDWVTNRDKGQDAVHALTTVPGSAGQMRSTGTNNFYVRFYFKESGTTSTRCPGGWPGCPSFFQQGPNGYKAMEFSAQMETAGINGVVLGTLFADSSTFAFGAGSPCYPSAPQQINQNQGNVFDHRQHRDEWIFVEMHFIESAGNGVAELWMDACGRDGRQCSGTPTLRTRMTGLNTANACQPGTSGQKIRTLWVNWWNTRMTGEIQFDEIVARDGEVLNAPIGFARITSGGTVQPPTNPPPTATAPEPPVLLPPQ